MEDGGYKLNLKPEVSTFSDHIVISYPDFESEDEHAEDVVRPLWAEFVCKDCVRVMSAVAERGLRLGLLIRGALSFGELLHIDDIVFGEALVDAYRLESEVAINPRVVVSDTVLKRLKGALPDYADLLLQDSDGFWHLNYIPQMRKHGADTHDADSALRWDAAVKAIVEANLTALKDRPRELSKWDWFNAQLQPTLIA